MENGAVGSDGGGAFGRMAQDLINDNSRFSVQVSSPFRRPFGRADDFLEDLLETSPFVVSDVVGKKNYSSRTSHPGLVDPVGTAEEIIQMRRVVAQDWKALMQKVPDDHIVIRQALLSNQMKRMQSSSDNEPRDSGSLDGFQ
jgi:hypothetical protein